MASCDFSGGCLIPGLPNDVSELCLLHLPFSSPALLRSVSSTWNRTLSNPSFFRAKSSLSLTKPYLLALATDQIGLRSHWQCLDPVSKNWFPLPPMPIPNIEKEKWPSMVSSVAKEKGEMYVFRRDSKSNVMVYSAATNSWRIGKCIMNMAGNFITSAAICGKVFAFSGDDGLPGDEGEFQVQCYDPVLDSSVNMARRKCSINRYNAAVIGRKVYMIERWSWPSEEKPYASIYDTELNTWQDMPVGMRLGWGWMTSAATLGTYLFVLSHSGDRKVKVYNHATDSWMRVKGSGIPELVESPYTVTADDENGKIYVVGRGLNVAIAALIEVEGKKWEIEWDVAKGPQALWHVGACNSQILYA